MNISILTVTDRSDFGKVLHHSCHVSHNAAQTYANNTVLPGLRERIEPEYHASLDVDICTMRVHGTE